ncbi:MAG TPA: hypothetical protein DCS93_16725 [Microscillaceae bacterium]|nr:hypothetical protein [Microscillaceae bacterium]
MYKRSLRKFILLIGLIVLLNNQFGVQAQSNYAGTVQLEGLQKEVEVYFDKFGVPHIYAKSEKDAYFALGYLHAQERWAQLDFYRRISTGRFAEIIGKAGIPSDQLVRTVGITENAKKSATLLRKRTNSRFKDIMLAYVAGLNAYVATGKLPLEFEMLKIPREKFTLEDIYAFSGLISFQLSLGFRSELVLNQIKQKLGDKYLKDLEYQFGTSVTPAYPKRNGSEKGSIQHPTPFKDPLTPSKKQLTLNLDESTIAQAFSARLKTIPGFATWLGSNSWVLAGKKTTTKKVIFCNDIHLGTSAPGIAFEAHVNFPGEDIYGYMIPLSPAFVVGNNSSIAYGNTSWLVDDIDYYLEKYKPGSHYQIEEDGKFVNLTVRQETIKVRGGEDYKFVVRSSRRGPIINDVVPDLAKDDQPLSLYWVFNKFPGSLMEAEYNLSIAKNLKEAAKAASLLVSPSLNVMYGDRKGNIAWWASAKLIKRKKGTDSKMVQDGSNTKNEPLGYYDFSQNPSAINPPSGFVSTANSQADKVDGALYPGNYVAGVRQKRLMDLFGTDKKWNYVDLQDLFMDDTSPLFVKISQEVLKVLEKDPALFKTPNHVYAAQLLRDWKGGHGVKEKAPTVFAKLLFFLVKNTLADELGEKLFKEMLPNPGFMNEVMSRTYPKLFFKEKSIWWNDITTNERSESRKEIFSKSFDETVQELIKQYPNTQDWQWGKSHQITYVNYTQNKAFTVGPFPMSGGMDVINKFGFALSNAKVHQVTDQPAQRMLVDFSDREKRSFGVLPMGNSGNPKSIFYKDQVNLYNQGKMRRQLTDRREIKRVSSLLKLKVK